MGWTTFDPADRTTYPPVNEEVEINYDGQTGLRAVMHVRDSLGEWDQPGTDLIFELLGLLPNIDLKEQLPEQGIADIGKIRAWRSFKAKTARP